MKFVSDILGNIENIASFYNIGLLIFFSLFVIILVRTIRMPKKEVEEIQKFNN